MRPKFFCLSQSALRDCDKRSFLLPPLGNQSHRPSTAMKFRVSLFFLLLSVGQFCYSQIPGLEAKNWYFGYGTDGIIFDINNIPYKVSNKMNNVGFEGIVVVNDPLSGSLLFYSDGQTVVNSSHAVMFNGTGLFGHFSGAQTVQCVPIPNQLGKFYLLTSRAFDSGGDNLFYSIVDFTDGAYPLGKVTNKNTLLSSAIYGQANKVVSKPNSTDYWWIGHVLYTNQYHIISITGSGFSAPTVYTATGSNGGDSYTMAHSPISNKIAASGLGAMGLVMMDFDNVNGVLSNPVQLFNVATGVGNFSPNGSKLYFIMDAGGYKLHQYDLGNGVTTNMNTCCYAHDTKTGPDGKMYHIHTYYSSTPIAVINNPDLSAVGNACGYNANAGIAGLFNGQVRRFPEFVVMPVLPPLGIGFQDFTATKQAGNVLLQWTISNNCIGCTFEIERGNGRGNYAVIGKVSGSTALQNSYTDANAYSGNWYYRVKLSDAAGKFVYSEVRQIYSSVDGKLSVSLFPNPCNDVLNILYSDPNTSLAKIEILDMAGRRLFVGTLPQSNFKIDVSMLAKGNYLLKLHVNGEAIYEKFEKQ